MAAFPMSLDVETVRRSGVSAGPWRSEDMVRLLAANVIGLATIGLSIYQSTQSSGVGGRLGWLNLGLAGLVIGGAGNGSWLLQGRRTVGVARQAILGPAPTTSPQAHTHVTRPEPVDGAKHLALVAVVHGSLYHRVSCAFAHGREVTSACREEHEKAGLRPCGVCMP